MNLIRKTIRFFLWRGLRMAVRLRQIILPGFDRIPLWDVLQFFYNAMVNGAISTRASAIAFNFFLAVFPALIFFFTLLPYIPIANFNQEIFSILSSILPENAFNAIKGTFNDIITQKRGSLLSFGFIAALFFSSNGIASLISAFNATANAFETRSWIGQRLISILLAVILVGLVTIAVGLIIFSRTLFYFLADSGILPGNFFYYLIISGKWLIIIMLFLIAISFLFYLAPAGKSQFRFISAGSTLATILIILTSLAFSFYINHFGQYNKLYGSIGTIMVAMLWLYFNSTILLIGFELNNSIDHARKAKKSHVRFDSSKHNIITE